MVLNVLHSAVQLKAFNSENIKQSVEDKQTGPPPCLLIPASFSISSFSTSFFHLCITSPSPSFSSWCFLWLLPPMHPFFISCAWKIHLALLIINKDAWLKSAEKGSIFLLWSLLFWYICKLSATCTQEDVLQRHLSHFRPLLRLQQPDNGIEKILLIGSIE